MVLVSFVGSPTVLYKAQIQWISDTRCALTFIDDAITSTAGWVWGKMLKSDGTLAVLGDYSKYTTICDVVGKTVTYSSDGSINAVVTLSAESVTLAVGGTQQVTATATANVTIPDSTVTWASADTAVATVSSEGVITGVAAGITMIFAEICGKTVSCTVTVA